MKKYFFLLALVLSFGSYSQTTINSLEKALTMAPAEVTHLNIRQKNYYDFPFELQKFDSLRFLNLMKNRLGNVPSWVSELKALEDVNLRQNLISELGTINLPNLKILHLEKNQLDTLYFTGSQLPTLQQLLLSNNGLHYIDQGLCTFTQLTTLSVAFNELKFLPNCTRFNKLQVLHAENNGLLQWPFKTAQLGQLKELHLSNNQIQSIPASIKNLKQLEVLNLSNNDLSTIPEEISELKQLKILTLSGNKLKNLPESIKNCDQLRHIYLVNNPISEEEIKKLKPYLPNCQIVK